jgi:hypothetical protein
VNVVAEERPAVERRTGSHAFAELLFRFRELGIVLALVIVVGAATIARRFLARRHHPLEMSAAIIACLHRRTIVIITATSTCRSDRRSASLHAKGGALPTAHLAGGLLVAPRDRGPAGWSGRS